MKRLLIMMVFLVMACGAYTQVQDSRKDSLKMLRDTARVLELDVDFFRKYAVPVYQKYDSTLDKIRLYEPTYDVYYFNSSLGNMGTAHQPMIFSVRPQTGFDHGLRSFDHYWFNEENINFYRTKRPFTEISYSLGSKSEQTLRLLHTQQIVNGLQLGVEYRHMYAEGYYNFQDAAVHHNFRFFGNYFSKSGRYKALFHFTHNDFKVAENGGLVDDSTFIKGGFINLIGEFVPSTNRELYDVHLSGAENRWYNNTASLQQSLVFFRKTSTLDTISGEDERDPLFTMMHKIHYDNAEFRYRDANPPASYYGPWYIDSALTRHSTYYQLLDNEIKAIVYLRKKFKSRSPLIAGFRHQYIYNEMAVNYKQGDTLEPDSTQYTYIANNLSVFANIRFDITGQLGVEARGEYFPAGYNQNDFLIGGSLFFNASDSAKIHHKVSAGAIYRQFSATYAQTRFITNHTQWNHNFGPQRLIHIDAKYEVPEWNFWLKGNVYLLNNFIYYDTAATPAQFGQFAAVFSAEAYKKVRFWKFYWENTVAGQYTSSNIIRVPNLILHSNFYYEGRLFKKSLLLRLGFDIWYFTPYKSYDYDPLTSQFYLQDALTVGNYPYLDIYISGRIKSVRIFARVRNVNQRIPSIPYFLTPGYPMQDRSVQFGVSWGFYN